MKTIILIPLMLSFPMLSSTISGNPENSLTTPCPYSVSATTLRSVSAVTDIPVSAVSHSISYTGFVQDGDKVYGTPGTTITISRETGHTYSVGIDSSFSLEASIVFGSASTSFGTNISASRTISRGESGSWTVPYNVTRGWIAVGSEKVRVTATVKYARPNCSFYTKQTSYEGIKGHTLFTHGSD